MGYFLLKNRGLWYKLRVFANLNERQIDISNASKLTDFTHFTLENLGNLLGFPESKEVKNISMGYTEHTTEDGVKERIEQCKNEIESGRYNSIFPARLTQKFEKHLHFKSFKLRAEAIADPDNHLQIGDIIGDNNSPQKYAIYIGNGEVC
uniref:Uncharacterized protein n=1 Tax=Panagrolaimus davidi TaxID=227884 RepID=A0A914QA34_9BILA